MGSHLILSAALLASVLLAGWLVRLAIRRHSRHLLGAITERPAAVPTLLYFTSENCPPCRLQQEPALHLLRERVGDSFALETIDVAESVEVARRYRVLSAPTTVVIDPQGAVRAVNVGVTSAEKLQEQLVTA